MISINVYITGFGAGGATRDVRVTGRSDTDGVYSVEVRDLNGIPFEPPGEVKLGCGLTFSIDVSHIPIGQFPLFVWVVECVRGNPAGEAVPLGPFLPTGSIDDGSTPRPGPMCLPPSLAAPPSAECIAARSETGQVRNDLIEACRRLHRLRGERDGSIAGAIAAFALAAAFFALATYLAVSAAAAAAVPIWGWAASVALGISAAIFFAIAAALLAAAIAATVAAATKQKAVSAAEREVDTLSQRFREAAMQVRSTCCPGDYIETEITLPTCA